MYTEIGLGDELKISRVLFTRQKSCHVGCLYNPYIVKYFQFIHEVDPWLKGKEPNYICRLTASTTRHQNSSGQFYVGPYTQIRFQNKRYEISRGGGYCSVHDPDSLLKTIGYSAHPSGLMLHARKENIESQLQESGVVQYGEILRFGFSISMDKLVKLYPDKGESLP